MQLLFIDYLTLLLINTAAGLYMLAIFVFRGIDHPERREWVPGFLIVGLISLFAGFHMTLHWPLPGAYNIAYGEMSVLFGAVLIGLAFALYTGIGLLSIGVVATASGMALIVIASRIASLGMTQSPMFSGIAFFLIGLCGVLSIPVSMSRKNHFFLFIVAVMLAISATILLYTGLHSYHGHLEFFKDWTPKSFPVR
jgi:putative membrane protein